jgi:hypothetical protein
MERILSKICGSEGSVIVAEAVPVDLRYRQEPWGTMKETPGALDVDSVYGYDDVIEGVWIVLRWWSSATETDLGEKSLMKRRERGYSDEAFREVMGEFQRQALFFWFVTYQTGWNLTNKKISLSWQIPPPFRKLALISMSPFEPMKLACNYLSRKDARRFVPAQMIYMNELLGTIEIVWMGILHFSSGRRRSKTSRCTWFQPTISWQRQAEI